MPRFGGALQGTLLETTPSVLEEASCICAVQGKQVVPSVSSERLRELSKLGSSTPSSLPLLTPTMTFRTGGGIRKIPTWGKMLKITKRGEKIEF